MDTNKFLKFAVENETMDEAFAHIVYRKQAFTVIQDEKSNTYHLNDEQCETLVVLISKTFPMIGQQMALGKTLTLNDLPMASSARFWKAFWYWAVRADVPKSLVEAFLWNEVQTKLVRLYKSAYIFFWGNPSLNECRYTYALRFYCIFCPNI